MPEIENTRKNNKDVFFDELTAQLVTLMEQGNDAWKRGWETASLYQANAKSSKAYSGSNQLRLMLTAILNGYKDNRWVTFNQAKELGGNVNKGERGISILTPKYYDRATQKAFTESVLEGMTEDEKKAYLKENLYVQFGKAVVFNAEQCSDLKIKPFEVNKPVQTGERNEALDELFAKCPVKIFDDGGAEAYYLPASDTIHIPKQDLFKTTNDYYATTLHEISHSTGHNKRLNRDLSGNFGSEGYAREELVAEFSAVFLQSAFGQEVSGEHIKNHAAYLKSWADALRSDKNFLPSVLAAAKKTTDFVKDYYAKGKDTLAMAEDDVMQVTEKEKTQEKNQGLLREQSIAEQDFPKDFESEFTETLLDDLEARNKPVASERETTAGNLQIILPPTGKKKNEQLSDIAKNIPKDLKDLPNWAAFWTKESLDEKTGKTRKEKYVMNASKGGKVEMSEKSTWAKVNDSETWTKFDTALAFARKKYYPGLSFALDGKSGITCIDLDRCIGSDGKLNGVAQEILALLPKTYVERSSSGNGLHIFLKGDILQNGTFKNRIDTAQGEIEVYDTRRFMSMTGNVLPGYDKEGVLECPAELKTLLQRKLGRVSTRSNNIPTPTAFKSDSEVEASILRSVKADEYRQLMSGASVTGDHSRDDFKLLNILAFFTKGNKEQMKRIFRSGGQYRENKGEAYLEHSASKAIETLYKPKDDYTVSSRPIQSRNDANGNSSGK